MPNFFARGHTRGNPDMFRGGYEIILQGWKILGGQFFSFKPHKLKKFSIEAKEEKNDNQNTVRYATGPIKVKF